MTSDQVDAFEEHLDQGLADMLGDLRRLTQANMAEEIERFSPRCSPTRSSPRTSECCSPAQRRAAQA